MDKIFRLLTSESTGLPLTGLTVRAVRMYNGTTYAMDEIPGTSGAGKYISQAYVPAGSYRLEKLNGASWEPLTNGDATAFVVEVEPGLFDQLAESTEPASIVEVAQILREEIHVAAFVPPNTAGTQTHINAAINYAINSGYPNRPRKIILGNVLNNATWNITSTITIPDYYELDLAGAVLNYPSGSGNMVLLGEGSKLTNGRLSYNGTGAALNSTATAEGSLVSATLIKAAGATSCPANARITFLSSSNVSVNDAAIVDPYSNANLQAAPDGIIEASPINLGRGATSLVSAKVRPSDLQAFFFRLCAPDTWKGTFDPLVAPYSNTDAISGERAGSALRAIMKKWGTLLDGTHRSQFKSTTKVAVVGSGALQTITPVGQAGQTLTIPANGLQIGSSVSGRIHFHTYTAGAGFVTNLAQIRLSIGVAYTDLYLELSENRSFVVEWNAKMIANTGNNLEVIGYSRATNATLGTTETKQWGGVIDKTATQAFSAQIKTPSGSNVNTQVYDLVVDK